MTVKSYDRNYDEGRSAMPVRDDSVCGREPSLYEDILNELHQQIGRSELRINSLQEKLFMLDNRTTPTNEKNVRSVEETLAEQLIEFNRRIAFMNEKMETMQKSIEAQSGDVRIFRPL